MTVESDENLSAAVVEQAFTSSGLLLEKRLALASQALAPPPSVSDDLKAALSAFRGLLASYLDTVDAAPAEPSLSSRMPPSATPAAEQPSAAPQAPPAPSPDRSAPQTLQRASAPSIVAAPPSAEAAPAAAPEPPPEVDGALSRHVLLQVASLPERTDAHVGDGSAARWTFEVPFALPQGTTIAQLEIARDGRQGASANATKAAWRARFSIDLEPIGPVHAFITFNGTPNGTLNGGRTAVTLWAERPETSAQLRADVGGLTQALRGAQLDPRDVLVRDGAPPLPRTALPAGHFLDRAT